MLNDQQQRELALLASLGCDRQTGCSYVGCSPGELSATLHDRPEFAASLRRAEATAEVLHMRCVHDAAKEAKNWRASVWWLERRAPDRFARRPTAALTADELQAVIDHLAAAIGEEIGDVEVRARVTCRLQQIAGELTHAFELPVAGGSARDESGERIAEDAVGDQEFPQEQPSE